MLTKLLILSSKAINYLFEVCDEYHYQRLVLFSQKSYDCEENQDDLS